MNSSVDYSATLQQLEKILKADQLLTQAVDCHSYGYDNSKLSGSAYAVVLPRHHDEVREIVQLANAHSQPLVARGRGTGTVGGAVPIEGGIVVSFEQMQSITHIDPLNRHITVQPGVTNAAVQKAAKAHGFFWPPDPSSAAFCSVGGNLAYNSAGPRAVKYGTCRENTLALHAITGDGRELRTGSQTSKSVVGYDLTRLLIGSEGTLALITEATLKLIPLASSKRTLQASYNSFAAATDAVSAIMAQGITPCALEFMDIHALNAIRQQQNFPLDPATAALLMIEVDGPESAMPEAVQAMKEAAKNSGLLAIESATHQTEIDKLWQIRKSLSPALRKIAPKKINEDVVVPVANMTSLINGVHEMTERYRIKSANFGHAGNGNIHVNLLVNDQDKDELARAELCLAELFALVISLNGSLSGEHGIGLSKKPFLELELDQTHLQLMQQIKQQFDPKGVLNPGK